MDQGSQKAVGSRAGSSHRLESRFVLGCIDTSDSESRRIFQHFSKSTRVSHLCTASFQIFALFCNFSLIFPEFYKKLRISQQIKHFSPQISRNFAGIAGNCGELPEHREFCSEFLKILIILTKFAEILRKSSRWLEPMASSRRLEPADVAGFLRALLCAEVRPRAGAGTARAPRPARGAD